MDKKANSMENRALKAIEEAVRSPQCRHVSKARGHEVAVRHGVKSHDVVFLNNLGTYSNRCGTSWCWTLIDTVSVVIRDTELHGDAGHTGPFKHDLFISHYQGNEGADCGYGDAVPSEGRSDGRADRPDHGASDPGQQGVSDSAGVILLLTWRDRSVSWRCARPWS